MFKQNYINIFENAVGDVSIAYAACGDEPLTMEDVQIVSIEKSDLLLISDVLKEIYDSIGKEGY